MTLLELKSDDETSDKILFMAACEGKLDVYKKIWGNFNLNTLYISWREAAKYGHLHILQWVYERFRHSHPSEITIATANGHLHILQWAIQLKLIWHKRNCELAASIYGHLNIIEFIDSISNIDSCTVSQKAAEYGQLHILKWIHDHKRNFDPQKISEVAALNGRLHVLEWLQTHNYLSNDVICSSAAQNGHLHVIKWAVDVKCFLNWKTCFNAYRNNHYHIIAWGFRKRLYVSDFMTLFIMENLKNESNFVNKHYLAIDWLVKTYKLFSKSNVNLWLAVIDSTLNDVLYVVDICYLIKSYI